MSLDAEIALNAESLLPCPFCGGKADIQLDGDDEFVRCASCNAGTNAGGIRFGFEDLAMVVRKWNRRAA